MENLTKSEIIGFLMARIKITAWELQHQDSMDKNELDNLAKRLQEEYDKAEIMWQNRKEGGM